MSVSVVIPAYNPGPLLAHQLKALTSQDYRGRIDIVVSDNGSGDGGTEVARTTPGVRLVDSSARRGAAPARNIGVAATTGDLILFCDADDVVDSGWVTAMVAALRHHDVVAGRADVDRLNSRRARAARPYAEGLQSSGGSLPYAGAGNLGIRRGAFLAVGGFDETLSCLEDVDLCWRLQRAGHDLHYEPSAVVHVRLRDHAHSQFVQGFNYGAGWARLEHRTEAQPPEHLTLVREASVERHGTSRWSTLRLLTGNVLRHPIGGAGAVIWAVGWHLGHRRELASMVRPYDAPEPERSRSAASGG